MYQKAVTLFQDHCSLRFSNENLVDSSPPPPTSARWPRTRATESVSGPAHAFGVVVTLLLEATLEHVATSALRFATAVLKVLGTWALPCWQHVRDGPTPAHDGRPVMPRMLVPAAVGNAGYLSRQARRKTLQWSCFLQFDDHPFFNGKPIVDLPPVPRGETRGKKIRITQCKLSLNEHACLFLRFGSYRTSNCMVLYQYGKGRGGYNPPSSPRPHGA